MMQPLLRAAALGALLLPAVASADTVNFHAQLESEPDNASTAPDAKGSASLSLDTATKAARLRIEYSGLTRPPVGVGCGEIEAPTGPVIWRTDHLESPVSGEQTLTGAQAAALAAGRWVCVIDTEEGDIGGALKPSQ